MFEYDFLISVPSQACHGFFTRIWYNFKYVGSYFLINMYYVNWNLTVNVLQVQKIKEIEETSLVYSDMGLIWSFAGIV